MSVRPEIQTGKSKEQLLINNFILLYHKHIQGNILMTLDNQQPVMR